MSAKPRAWVHDPVALMKRALFRARETVDASLTAGGGAFDAMHKDCAALRDALDPTTSATVASWADDFATVKAAALRAEALDELAAVLIHLLTDPRETAAVLRGGEDGGGGRNPGRRRASLR